MADKVRIAIVGAGSLAGKELAEALEEGGPFASAQLVLLDDAEALGRIEAIGDEVAVVQAIEPDSFANIDYVFFTASRAQASTHWRAAAAAHASIIDMTGALEGEPGVLLAAPWLQEALESPAGPAPDLYTPALVPAQISAMSLALVLARIQDVGADAGAVRSAWATVCLPASEHGRAAVDELHQQTVSLLNFQGLPQELFDMQVAFNLSPSLGEAAKPDLLAISTMLRRHYGLLSGGRLPQLATQVIQVPAFHGCCISVGLELETAVPLEHVEAALSGAHVDLMPGENDPPNNLSCAGHEDLLVRVRQEDPGEALSTRFWLWIAFDNLKLASLHAIACAAQLGKLRPQGKVQ